MIVSMTKLKLTLSDTVQYDQLSNRAQVSVLITKKQIRFNSIKHSP